MSGRLLAVGVCGLLAAFTPAARGQRAAYAQGSNTYGQLGNGTTTYSASPVPVTDLGSGVTAVSGGAYHSLAVQGGAVYAWGANGNGEVGDGTSGNLRTSPVAVVGLGSGVTAVSAGGSYSLALQGGQVYAWGSNSQGALGTGDFTNHITPVAVTGLGGGVTAIAAGAGHNLVIKGGQVYAWGNNSYTGQVGNGTTNNQLTPVALPTLASGVTAVAAGYSHSLAVQGGAVYAWGSNGYGEVGIGTATTAQTTPAAVAGLGSGVTAITAGFGHSLAIKGGQVFAWGRNSSGQLGDGTTTNQTSPFALTTGSAGDLPTDFTAVTAEDYGSFALTASHRLYSWGFGGSLLPTELFAPTGYQWENMDGGGNHLVVILTPVPEPAAVLAVAAVGLAAVRLRRRM